MQSNHQDWNGNIFLEIGDKCAPKSSEMQSWRARSGYIGPEVAKKIQADPRIEQLPLECFGLYMLLQARSVTGLITLADPKKTSRLFGVSPKVFTSMLNDLLSSNPTLVVVNQGVLHVQPVGRPVAASLAASRSMAAHASWEARKITDTKVSLPMISPTPAAEPAEQNATAVPSIIQNRKEISEKVTGFKVKAQPPSIAHALLAMKTSKSVSSTLVTNLAPVQLSIDGVMPIVDAATPDQPATTTKPAKTVKPQPRAMFNQIASAYRSICIDLPSLSDPKDWPESRQRSVKSRASQSPDIDWNDFFAKVHASDWLCGRVESSSWKANFDWIMKPSNFIKIIEGTYQYNGSSRPGLFNQGGKAKANQYQETVIADDEDFMRIAEERIKKDGQSQANS